MDQVITVITVDSDRCLNKTNHRVKTKEFFMKKRMLLSLICVFLGSDMVSAGSCCGSGSSSLAVGMPVLNKGQILVQPGYEYTQTSSRDIVRNTITTGIGIGVTDRLLLSKNVGFSFLETTNYREARVEEDPFTGELDTIAPSLTEEYKNQGVADGSLGIQFAIIPMDMIEKRQELLIGVNLGIPWGSTDKRGMVDGVETILSKKNQIGSGVFSCAGFLTYTKSFPLQRFTTSGTVIGQLNFKDDIGQEMGNEINIQASAILGPFGPLKISLPVNYQTIGKTKDLAGEYDPSTGGSRIDVLPSMEFLVNKDIRLVADVAVPLWRTGSEAVYGNNLSLRLSGLFFISTK